MWENMSDTVIPKTKQDKKLSVHKEVAIIVQKQPSCLSSDLYKYQITSLNKLSFLINLPSCAI